MRCKIAILALLATPLLLCATAEQPLEALPAAEAAANLPALQQEQELPDEQTSGEQQQKPASNGRMEQLGEYTIVSRVRCVNGQLHEVQIDRLGYSLSSDGSTIYMQINAPKRPFKGRIEFIITRDDGIQISSADGKSSELVPGLQASGKNGKITRHLTLTANFLQIVEIAAHSPDVIITRARRN